MLLSGRPTNRTLLGPTFQPSTVQLRSSIFAAVFGPTIDQLEKSEWMSSLPASHLPQSHTQSASEILAAPPGASRVGHRRARTPGAPAPRALRTGLRSCGEGELRRPPLPCSFPVPTAGGTSGSGHGGSSGQRDACSGGRAAAPGAFLIPVAAPSLGASRSGHRRRPARELHRGGARGRRRAPREA